MTANAYTFLPWLRIGLATKIAPETGQPGPEELDRATIPVTLRVAGDRIAGSEPLFKDITQPVQLYGPGDVIGVDPRAISRLEPRPWITNVEPNYLAHIEFYHEDFPWRYSPAGKNETTNRLRPWLALVVLAGGSDPKADAAAEFTEGVQGRNPLPFVTVGDPAGSLPDPELSGAWAHVHVNGQLDVPVRSGNVPTVLSALQQVLRTNPDSACSRLLCPRHLKPNTSYHAFLVPAFETGRLAGLGLDPAASPGALYPSWGGQDPDYTPDAPGALPYYHRWFFGTGSAGDFEALVELLQPRRPDDRVARRDIDVHSSAGPGLPGITKPAGIGGVLRLGGALKVPKRPLDLWDQWDDPPPTEPPDPPDPTRLPYPQPFQKALAGLINLADEYLAKTPADAHTDLQDIAGPPAEYLADEVDPIITPPLYGRWPALTSRLLYERDGTPIESPLDRNWVHRLNLDPRFRVAANFGTQIVQKRQEEFMNAAWAQVGDVLRANAKIRAAQLAREVGHALHKHLDPQPDPAAPAAFSAQANAARSGRALRLTAPANERVAQTESAQPAALVAGPAARLAGGPGAGLTELLTSVTVGFRVADSVVAATPVSPAMRRITRPRGRVMRSIDFGQGPPADALLDRMDAVTDPVRAAAPKTTPEAVVTTGRLADVLHPEPEPPQLAGPSSPAVATGDPVDDLPFNEHFQLTPPETNQAFPPSGQSDSDDARQYKDALRELNQSWASAAASGQARTRERLEVDTTAGVMLTGLSSDLTVPNDLLASLHIPDRLLPFAQRFIEAMAYPVIDLPMYDALLGLGVDTFVPNLDLIPPNTITLLETNQEFIEAFLVGLNHELARELLWREYPTDQRGSPFRQFWDPGVAAPLPGEKPADRRERLYDITPIHTWDPASSLGQHDNRETGAPPQEDELVLVIRGELLKKYPTAAVYAHRADWGFDEDGAIDRAGERRLADLADPEHPPAELVRLPRYEAKVEPDIYLLGFDLTADEALGKPLTDPGWFFVIKERPGDPRFGADVDENPNVEVWNDLAWPDIDPGSTGFIALDPANTINLQPLSDVETDPDNSDDAEKREQQAEDWELRTWHAGLSSAEIAYMLFQAPVLMGVHAQEMLPRDQPQ